MREEFGERSGRVDRDAFGEERLAGVPGRDEYRLYASALGCECLWQDAAYAPERPVEREFSYKKRIFFERFEVARRDEIGDGEREVVVRTFFLQVGWREREDDPLVLLLGRLVAAVAYRGRDAVARLVDRLVREADDREVV